MIKGVEDWSLIPEDNATIDPEINWREGQMPSTVNDSARVMMSRIKASYNELKNDLSLGHTLTPIMKSTTPENHDILRNIAININVDVINFDVFVTKDWFYSFKYENLKTKFYFKNVINDFEIKLTTFFKIKIFFKDITNRILLDAVEFEVFSSGNSSFGQSYINKNNFPIFQYSLDAFYGKLFLPLSITNFSNWINYGNKRLPSSYLPKNSLSSFRYSWDNEKSLHLQIKSLNREIDNNQQLIPPIKIPVRIKNGGDPNLFLSINYNISYQDTVSAPSYTLMGGGDIYNWEYGYFTFFQTGASNPFDRPVMIDYYINIEKISFLNSVDFLKKMHILFPFQYFGSEDPFFLEGFDLFPSNINEIDFKKTS